MVEIPNERPYLHYIETVSKNNPGGLKGRKNSAKEVKQHSNESKVHFIVCSLLLLFFFRRGYSFVLPSEDVFDKSDGLSRSS